MQRCYSTTNLPAKALLITNEHSSHMTELPPSHFILCNIWQCFIFCLCCQCCLIVLQLRRIDCLGNNFRITELHLQYNYLKDITGALCHLTQLQVLMLQGNQLTNLEKVVREFRKMQNLQILSELAMYIYCSLFSKCKRIINSMFSADLLQFVQVQMLSYPMVLTYIQSLEHMLEMHSNFS